LNNSESVQKSLLHSKEKMMALFQSGKTLDIKFRQDSLKKLKSVIRSQESQVFKALHLDLGRTEYESYLVDVSFVYKEIDFFVDNLAQLSEPRGAASKLALFPSSAEIIPCPRGIGLIIAPWNYPFLLAMMPLVGSVAAGNCSYVKPSEVSPATSNIIEKIVKEAFSEDHVKVLLGGPEVTQELLALSLDHIFFTGSPRVGKIIASKAAEHLTPVTLELGGKSPCVVDKTSDIKTAAKRILWAKYINSGQTCIAPDYLILHKDIEAEFLSEIKKVFSRFDISSPSYSKIINAARFHHLKDLLNDGEIIIGGKSDLDSLRFEITLVRPKSGLSSPLMKEEIFGPILPVVTFDSESSLLDLIAQNPNPLAMYLFSKDRDFIDRMIHRVSCGGVCVNDLMVHIAPNSLPFGGVRGSGYGQYHGVFSFETFSHFKPVMRRGNWLDPDFKYPPFPENVPAYMRQLF
jgi:aldehyde dehydrogenase (NAD+)